MDDDERDYYRQPNNSYRQTDDNWDRREEEPYRANRNRDHDRSRNRRWHRERRRSRSRSPPRRRDRDRDSDRSRRRYDYDDDESRGDRRNDVPSNRYDDEHYHREDSTRLDRHDGRQKPEQDWRLKLTNIRDAHFNRSKQAPSSTQNQFTNDGSFLEKFKQMTGESSNVMPNSLALASSSIQFDSEISLPPLTTMEMQEPSQPVSSKEDNNDLDGVPIKKPVPVPVPVSIGRRRLAKPLKTGVVFKKTQQSEEDEASQEKLDAWSKYLNAMQQYKKGTCADEDTSRPLVK